MTWARSHARNVDEIGKAGSEAYRSEHFSYLCGGQSIDVIQKHDNPFVALSKCCLYPRAVVVDPFMMTSTDGGAHDFQGRAKETKCAAEQWRYERGYPRSIWSEESS